MLHKNNAAYPIKNEWNLLMDGGSTSYLSPRELFQECENCNNRSHLQKREVFFYVLFDQFITSLVLLEDGISNLFSDTMAVADLTPMNVD